MNVSPISSQAMAKGPGARFAPHGFTLIELLVTVAIIVIAASLGFQGTQSVRRQAAATRSIANMKAIIGAWNFYANDNNNLYPIGLTWTATAADIQNPPSELKTLNYRYWWRWYGGVASYLPTLVISDTEAANNYGGPKAPQGWDGVWKGYFPPDRVAALRKVSTTANTGYHFNTYMGYNRRIKRSRITEMSKVPVLFPYWEEGVSNPMNRYFSSPLPTDTVKIFMDGARKASGNDGNHFAFADGHVEWVPAMATAKEYEDRFVWRPY